MLSEVYSVGLKGISGFIVTVECSSWERLPSFEIVGLPDAAVKEAKERVRAACENSGTRFPGIDLMVNLAPANMKKEGSFFDVAILISILRSSKKINKNIDLSNKCFIGELSLSGDIRPVKGVLSMAFAAKQAGFSELYVPKKNANEAAVVEGIDVYGAGSINELVAHLNGSAPLEKAVYHDCESGANGFCPIDFSDVKGQEKAKRAMEIAAAGGHNILLIGPPGSGKSMLAKCLPGVLPDMTFDEAVETTMVHSVAGDGCSALMRVRPFRAPHHTVSAPGLIGGGTNPRPGEVSLAHNGVLFLDEFPEFNKNLIDALRQPTEDGSVTVTRASGSVTYPSSFMMVCAMNPCRCGYFGDPNRKCTCSEESVHRYLSKISGPMLDRMDIQVELPSITYDEISSRAQNAEKSASVKARVDAAREFASQRYRTAGAKIVQNADLSPREVREYCKMDESANNLLRTAFEKFALSARAHDKILRVARTISDLDKSDIIKPIHIAEAVQYRTLDRKYWHR